MDPVIVTFVGFFLLVMFLLIFYLIRAGFRHQRRRSAPLDKKLSEVGFVVDTFHDLVSGLKEKEKELEVLRDTAEKRASAVEIYNENILQSVPSGVLSFDQNLQITKMNSSAGEILELSESDTIGRKLSEVFHSPVREIVEKREVVERAEASYTTKSGKRMWLGLTVSPLKDSSRNVIGQILVFTDLTELKAFQSQMELRERLSTLGEMSAGIAHELRNPLAVISGYTTILSKKVDQSLMPAVAAISKEVDVMDRIIRDFLSFARPTELVISRVDMNELIRGCIHSVEESAQGISILRETDELPVIRADEVLLRQSITNLLQNSVEAMPEGGELKVSGKAGDFVEIVISDTGHGIPDAIKDKVFLPFYTTKERGTGLGLSIVHKVVASHGGTIGVESTERGTTFTIKFPGEIILSG